MMRLNLLLLLVSLHCISCDAIKETSSHQMQTGIYKVSDQKNKKFYTVVEDDKVTLYPAIKSKGGWTVAKDTASKIPLLIKALGKQSIFFSTGSFDIDVLTILFKYRPVISGFPNQLNTNFNGGGFIGYRSDYYLLSYKRDPLNNYRQSMNHFAYSTGFFGGLGSTNMNPFVTNNQVQAEYDGVVITKGIAGLIGVGNLTFGAAFGLDHIADRNHKVWIYQGKPWFGFTVGLNVN